MVVPRGGEGDGFPERVAGAIDVAVPGSHQAQAPLVLMGPRGQVVQAGQLFEQPGRPLHVDLEVGQASGALEDRVDVGTAGCGDHVEHPLHQARVGGFRPSPVVQPSEEVEPRREPGAVRAAGPRAQIG